MIRNPLITQPDPLRAVQNDYVIEYLTEQLKIQTQTKPEQDYQMKYFRDNLSIMASGTYYYDQLTNSEQKIYKNLVQLIENNQNFLINIPHQVNGSKLAHSYNLDHIFNYKGKVVYKTGQLQFKSYDAAERFGYYLKNRDTDFIETQIKQLIDQNTSYIDQFQCVNQIIEKLAIETKLTTNWQASTIFDCLVAKKCNALGLARTFVALLRKFQVNSFVVGGLLLKKEHYWNVLEYDTLREVVQMPISAMGGKESKIYSCVDIYVSVLNMIEQYVPGYHINIDIDRMNVDHNFIQYFQYPKTTSFKIVEQKVLSHQQLREVIKKASFQLNRLNENISKNYYDIFIDFGQQFEDTKEFLKQCKADIQSIILRYAPNFVFKDLIFPRSNTPAVTMEFQRLNRQDFLLYPEIVSQFDVQKHEQIIQFLLCNIKNMQKLVIPLNTDIELGLITRHFSEEYMHEQLQKQLFDVSNIYDSCIYRYTLSAHCIVIIFIQIPVYNQVPKFARRNRFLLNRNQLYVYSMIIQNLMKRLDEVVIPYMEQISEQQLLNIIQCIRLDYPELYFIPTTNISSSSDLEKRELKVIVPLPDFTRIHRQDSEMNKIIQELQMKFDDKQIEVTREQQILQKLVDNYFPFVTINENAVSAYDFLVDKQISSMSIAAAFGLLCQTIQLPTCVIKSEKSSKCVNLVFIKTHVTISDVFVQYIDKIMLGRYPFYPTFSININSSIFSLIDNTFNELQTKLATRTFNSLYTTYFFDSTDEQSVQKLKNIFWEQFLQKFYNIQICYRNLSKQDVEKFLQLQLIRVTTFMLVQHSPIHPCRFRIHYSAHLPVILIQLNRDLNCEEITEKIENLEPTSQKRLLQYVKHAVSQNKNFAFVKLSTRTLPELYQQQFEKYQFAQFFVNQLDKEVKLRGATLKVQLLAREYCVVFDVSK
ncbi:Conserved_hypothetical protein [Hexamita inflata]|uniref:Uncharacterized protein n=1 Tax=Hexamita inflata TaxID=28002 RepID=A0ABP1H0J2_9EUKA